MTDIYLDEGLFEELREILDSEFPTLVRTFIADSSLRLGEIRTAFPRGQADEVRKADKVSLLQRIDDTARSIDGAIVQVSAGYGDSRKHVLVANTDGVLK